MQAWVGPAAAPNPFPAGRGLLLVLAVALAGALGVPTGARAQDQKPDAGVAFLQKVQAAARSLDYSGVYTYQQGTSMQSTRIVHVVDGTGERERLEILDGEPREYLRQGSISQTLIPAHKLVLLQSSRSDHFPSLLLGEAAAIPAHYELRQSSRSYRVAGRDCAVSELLARDSLRYSYRICTDLESHLMLKAQTLDGQGRVVDQVPSATCSSARTPTPMNSIRAGIPAIGAWSRKPSSRRTWRPGAGASPIPSVSCR